MTNIPIYELIGGTIIKYHNESEGCATLWVRLKDGRTVEMTLTNTDGFSAELLEDG
jgi:hypothetical protein